jgi:hypothetical protein
MNLEEAVAYSEDYLGIWLKGLWNTRNLSQVSRRANQDSNRTLSDQPARLNRF